MPSSLFFSVYLLFSLIFKLFFAISTINISAESASNKNLIISLHYPSNHKYVWKKVSFQYTDTNPC